MCKNVKLRKCLRFLFSEYSWLMMAEVWALEIVIIFQKYVNSVRMATQTIHINNQHINKKRLGNGNQRSVFELIFRLLNSKLSPKKPSNCFLLWFNWLKTVVFRFTFHSHDCNLQSSFIKQMYFYVCTSKAIFAKIGLCNCCWSCGRITDQIRVKRTHARSKNR